MKNFELNTISIQDVLHTLRECDRNERYEGMFEHMLTFASELTGISEDALLAEMYPEKSLNETTLENDNNPRLSALREYNANAETIRLAEKREEERRTKDLISRIQALEPRIKELIETGNACLQTNIPLTGQGFGMRESYDTNQFFTNSWSHLVGFVGNPNLQPCHIEFLGINAGGACGRYDFRTDGVNVFSVHENKPFDVITPSIGYMERFLKNFDAFESAFYAYIDKTIENQRRSLSAQLQSASTRASSVQPSSIVERGRSEPAI